MFNTSRLDSVPMRLCFVLVLVCGCGGGQQSNSPNSTTPNVSPSPFTGSWAIEAPDANGQITFGAYFTVTGQAVSGSVSPIPFSRCFSSPPPVATIQGTLSGIALNLNSSMLIITATANQSDTGFGGSYQIVSGCNESGSVTGIQVPSLGGKWAGALSSSSGGGSLNISATLSQRSLDQQGFPTLTGQVNIQGSPCLTTGQLTADQRGLYIGGPGLPGGADAGSGYVDVGGGVYVVITDGVMADSSGNLNTSGNSLRINYMVVGGACQDSGGGTLARQ